MDTGVGLELAIQNTRQVQAPQTSTTKTDGNEQSATGFQDLLDQCRKELNEAADQTPGSEQTTGKEPEKDKNNPETAEQLEAMAQLALSANFPQAAQIPVENLQQSTAASVVEAVAAPQALGQQAGIQQAEAIMPGNEQPQSPQTGEAAAPVTNPAETVITPIQAEGETQSAAADTRLPEQSQPKTDDQNNSDSQLDASVISNSWNTALFGELDQAPVRVGDSPVDMTQPAQQVQKDLSVRLQSALERGEDHLTIQMEPENLGTVVAEFTRNQEGVLHVVLHAQREQTAHLLQEHAPALGLLLQDNTHGEVQVQVAQPQQDQTAWQQDGRNGGQQQQRQQQQHRNPNQNESESFLHQLRLGLVQQSIQPV